MIQQGLTCQRMERFTEYLFDQQDQVTQAALIRKAILEARSPRLSDLSQMLPGNQDDSTLPESHRWCWTGSSAIVGCWKPLRQRG